MSTGMTVADGIERFDFTRPALRDAAEALEGAGTASSLFDFPAARRRRCHEIVQELLRSPCNGIHGVVKRGGIRQRRLLHAADLADVLDGCVVHLAWCRRRLEVVEALDVLAHGRNLASKAGLRQPTAAGTIRSGCPRP